MPKAPRRSKAATLNVGVVATERPRRSTRVKPTCDKAENIIGTDNSKSKRSCTSRGRPKRQSQPLYTRSVSQVNSDPNRHLPFFKLPTELLKLIASTHLPLESSLSLSLTCKEALSTLGTWSWAAFKQEKRWSPSRTNFFKSLSRDFEQQETPVKVDLEFCRRCNTLHPGLQPPRRHRKTALTTYCFGQDACIDYLPQRSEDSQSASPAELSSSSSSDLGWSLVFAHIQSALSASSSHSEKGQSGPLIPLLSGSFTTTLFPASPPTMQLTLGSSARRIDGNLVVRHEYVFRNKSAGVLCAKDVLERRIYLCPHQCSTRTGPSEKSWYLSGESGNSPVFTYAVNAAFEKKKRWSGAAAADDGVFRKPTPCEKKAIEEAEEKEKNGGGGDGQIWTCRSCPTKYRVEGVEKGQLRIVSWHCFGRDPMQAQKVWRRFVRREGIRLGRDKRNDEWWSPSGMGGPDFEIGE